jgi:hypothetical protein
LAQKGDALLTGEAGGQPSPEDAPTGAEATAELNGDLPFSDSDELRSLITQGRERGYLTFEEIAGTLEGSRSPRSRCATSIRT